MVLKRIDRMTLLMLGSGGFYPSSERETSCYILTDEERLLIFDCGTGLARIGSLIERLDFGHRHHIQIFLSHYHLDHSIGVTWLPGLLTQPTTVHYPQAPAVSAQGEEGLRALTSPPLFALPFADFPDSIGFEPIDAATALEIGDWSVTFLSQEHAGGSVGFRVNDSFAYVTDTDIGGSPEHVAFLEGVDVALVDSMYDTDDHDALVTTGEPVEHGSSRGVAAVASEAGVDRPVLVHLNPRYDSGRLDRMCKEAQEVLPSCTLGTDGFEFELGE